MAKRNSKSRREAAGQRTNKHRSRQGIIKRLKIKTRSLMRKVQDFRAQHIHLHRSFRRSYREDYVRETKTPGLLSHAMLTFKELFKHWRTFGLLLILIVALYVLLVGLMSEEFYQEVQASFDASAAEIADGKTSNFLKASLLLITTITSGGLDTGMGEAQTVFMILIFLLTWLVTIFLLRHFFAGESPRLRDGLYNALGPLFATLLVFLVIFVQAIPLMVVAITYSAAVLTDFLSTPFYALVYFIFAASMILLSGYLLSSSIIALIATTAPGMYPLKALTSASDLMAGRRVKFIIRLLYVFFVIIFLYVIIMLPIILLDLLLKHLWDWIAAWPIVPFFLLVVTCFAFIYLTAYLYLYYRWLLDQDDNLPKKKSK